MKHASWENKSITDNFCNDDHTKQKFWSKYQFLRWATDEDLNCITKSVKITLDSI